MSQNENQRDKKSLQADEDARHEGMEQLENWGRMLRSEPRVGPAGFKQSPMFKDIISRYADDAPRVRETFRADDAYIVMDLIEHIVKDPHDKTAIYLYYAESSTYANTQSALEEFNKYLDQSDYNSISETRFRKLLNSVEIRIGTALDVCGSDEEWMLISRLMAS